MNRDVDHIHVAVLASAIGVPIWVENCQLSGELNRITFDPDSASPTEAAAAAANETATPVTLLYRPGHYDILYAN